MMRFENDRNHASIEKPARLDRLWRRSAFYGTAAMIKLGFPRAANQMTGLRIKMSGKKCQEYPPRVTPL